MTKKSKIYLITACLIFIILLSYTSVFILNIGEQAIVTQFGKVSELPITEPGLHLKIPFIQKINYLPNHRVFEFSHIWTTSKLSRYGALSLKQHFQYKIVDPIKYFVNFSTNLNIKNQIIKALEELLERELMIGDIVEIDSSTQDIRIKNGVETVILNEANMLLKTKGIQILKWDITGK